MHPHPARPLPAARPTWRTLGRAAAPLVLAPLLAAAACGGGGSTDPGPTPVPTCTFTNPVATGADPSIVRRNGVYHAVQSRDGGIVVTRSTNLSDVMTTGAVRVWTPQAGAPNAHNIWAPQLQFLDGKWYIYHAASPTPGGPFTGQRTFVLESETDDPQGRWIERGQIDTGGEPTTRADDVWAIDMTVARFGGQLYALWSGWERNAATDQTQQNLYIAPMSSPTTVSGPRVRISQPDQPWEDIPNSFDLQEGPEVLERAGRTFIVYSTQGSWTSEYRYGLLELTNPAAPTNPASYRKSAGPVFQKTADVLGPGHGTFALSPDGSESWMIYHANPVGQPGWGNRVIRMQPFTWNVDGTPSFGQPVEAGRALPRPAGECRP